MAINKIQIIGLCLLLFYSCESTPTKPVILKKLPKVLYDIKKNNEKIPSFQCDISISSKSKGKHLVADGKAYIDKVNNKIKITLVDTLADEVLLDLIIVNNKITLFILNEDGGILIQDHINNLKLDRYIPKLTIDLKDLINLISIKSLIFEEADEIKEQVKKDYFYYLLKKQNKLQVLSVNKNSNKIEKLSMFENKKNIFLIHYDKYFSHSNFYFPKRSIFHHSKSASVTTVYLSRVIFSPNLTNNIFILKDYPKAKRLF